MNLAARVNFVRDEVCTREDDITVAFSGGKDSSAVLRIAYAAIQSAKRRPRLRVLYCDTGVENPVIDEYVKGVLGRLSAEMRADRLNAEVVLVRPEVYQSFFVRVIGRGYPPPTNAFRWCTKDLRIRPVQRYLKQAGARSLVLLGTRKGESQQRDRSIRTHSSSDATSRAEFYQRQNNGGGETRLFLPIIDFSADDVWQCLVELRKPFAIDSSVLVQLYRDGAGECPAIREFVDKPCARARFGCWTCTVVRRDKSGENLIASGYEELAPLNEFRKWLLEVRGDARYRCLVRRNGVAALGPLTLAARSMIFQELRALEGRLGRSLLSSEEIALIKTLWLKDRESPQYLASEPLVTG